MNNSKRITRKTWSESDAVIACKIAKEYNYSDDSNLSIGNKLNRSPQGVRMLITRIHDGTHSLIVSHDSRKLAKFVNKSITKTPTSEPKTTTRQPMTQRGISILWGVIDIKL